MRRAPASCSDSKRAPACGTASSARSRGTATTLSRMQRARTALGWLRTVRPWPLLLALAAVQVALALWFGFKTPHNGWIWYSGGDATEYWTEQWSLGHLLIPQTIIGPGLPVYYAWVPLVAGPTLLNGAAI